MNKEERIEIYEETVDIVRHNPFTTETAMVEGTKFYGKKALVDYTNIPRYETEIKVVNNDCLYEAEKFIQMGLNPCVLNMASGVTPGGGVTRGAGAQEENLFRRTDLFKSLYQFHPIGLNYGVKQREERYPLEYNFGGIYTPSVTVFRGGEDVNYKRLDNVFTVSVVSVPAVKKPPLDNGKIVPWAVDTIKNKIRQIFDIALENGHDSLVLSAFGCGVYCTPPEQMAKLFHDVLESKRHKGAFKVIHFAIIDVPSTNGTHNPQGNLKPFKDVFPN